MLRRVGVAISVGLADSLNPSTVGPALYIATGRHRVWRVTQFTVGVFSVSFVGGVVLTIGPGRLRLGLVPHPQGTVRHVIERAVGVVLLVLAVAVLVGRRSLARRELPGRGECEHSRRDRAARPLQRCLRGPTAGDRRGNVGCGTRADPWLQKGGAWLQRRWPVVFASLLLFVGSVLAVLAAVVLSGNSEKRRPVRPGIRTARSGQQNGSAPSATGAGAAPEGVEIRQFFRRMNDATVRQSASPTPWHPIRPPSSRLERRPYSAGHAGVCTPSLAPALAPSRETLVMKDSLWLGGVARGLA